MHEIQYLSKKDMQCIGKRLAIGNCFMVGGSTSPNEVFLFIFESTSLTLKTISSIEGTFHYLHGNFLTLIFFKKIGTLCWGKLALIFSA